MSSERDDISASTGELTPLERNRYFYGKLMTPRDMRAEQAYHRGRTDTLSRFVTGRGIVHGLEVGSPEDRPAAEAGGRPKVSVTVDPGLAIDGEGRLLVVEKPLRPEFDGPTADGDVELHLYLRYEESDEERVPTPDLGSAVSERTEYNRLVESPRVEHEYVDTVQAEERRVAADKPVPLQRLSKEQRPGKDATLDPADPRLRLPARAFDASRGQTTEEQDPKVFLGAFRGEGGDWTRTVDRGPFVYTNDMLYSLLVAHMFDYENPHNVEGAKGDRGLRDELGALRARHDELVDVLLLKSIKDVRRTFDELAAHYSDKDLRNPAERARAVSELAAEVFQRGGREEINEALRALHERFLEHLKDEELQEIREEEIPEEEFVRYERALGAMQQVIEEPDSEDLKLVRALDGVIDSARTVVIPE